VRAATAPPSPVAQAKGLLSAAGRWLAGGLATHGSAEVEARLAVCHGRNRIGLPPPASAGVAPCAELRSGVLGPWCNACGCWVNAKAALATETCPRGLWPGDAARRDRGDADAARAAAMLDPRPLRTRLTFPHGIGDHVQFTTVLRHLAALRSDLIVSVRCRTDCARLLAPWCSAARPLSVDPADLAATSDPVDVDERIQFSDPAVVYDDCPSTKAERCLREVFDIDPQPELCRYGIELTDDDLAEARTLLETCEGRSARPKFRALRRSAFALRTSPCSTTRASPPGSTRTCRKPARGGPSKPARQPACGSCWWTSTIAVACGGTRR
jgi:hypothetical protein